MFDTFGAEYEYEYKALRQPDFFHCLGIVFVKIKDRHASISFLC